ncbi:DOMON-like domain-containing protein [Sphingomonas sp. JC676]|nr:DOMON-like domain-containing protein [Sphingomonas sp. JC676]
MEVEITATDWRDALIEYVVHDADMLVVPEPATPTRADGLWQTTCFELFVRPEGAEGYFEFNFSPSSQWAAYSFAAHRTGRQNLEVSVEPHIGAVRTEAGFKLEVDVDFSELANRICTANLTAVIEEADGTKSYWALAHPPGEPNFHDPACFTLELPAARPNQP